jgi:maltokinase
MRPSPGASAELAHRLAPALVTSPGAPERDIEVDQTNVSVVVAEAAIVKWLDPPSPTPHPGVELLDHLREVGFDEMPHFHGALVIDGLVTAVVSEFIVGAVDGWDWFVDEFTGVADAPDHDRSAPADTVVSSARRLGALAARLHVALATPSEVFPRPVATASAADEAARGQRLLDEACREACGDARDLVRDRYRAISAALAALDAIDETLVQRLHGDLHVGQVLRSPDSERLAGSSRRLAITDFDGDPIAQHGARRHRRPAAADVAGLAQSIDHAGRVAIARRPGAASTIADVIGVAVDASIAGYRAQLAANAASHLLDERLVWPLRLAQELHELVYAARHLPRWTYAPAATLTAMLP